MKMLPTILVIPAVFALVAVAQLHQRSKVRQSYDTHSIVLSTDGDNPTGNQSIAVLESPSSLADQSSIELEITDSKIGPAGYQDYIDHSSNDARAMSPDQWSDTGDLTFAAPSSAIPIQQMPVQNMPIQQMPSMNGSPVINNGSSAAINSYPSTNQPPIQPMPGQSIVTEGENVDQYQSSVSPSAIAPDPISPEPLSAGVTKPDPVPAAPINTVAMLREQARKNATRFGLTSNPHYKLAEEHFSSPIEEPSMASEIELQEGSVVIPNSSPVRSSFATNDTPPLQQQPEPAQQASTMHNSSFSMQSDPADGQGMITSTAPRPQATSGDQTPSPNTAIQNHQPAQQFNQPVQQYHQPAPQYQTYHEGGGNNAYPAALPAHASLGTQPVYGSENTHAGNFYNGDTGLPPSEMADPIDHGFVAPPTNFSTSYPAMMQGPEFQSTQLQPQTYAPQTFGSQTFGSQLFAPQSLAPQSLAPQFRGDVGQRSPFKTIRPQPFQSYEKFAFEDKEQFPKPGELLKTAVYFMDLELGVLQPSFQNNTAISSTSPSFSSTQSFDFDYDTAPRVRVGFESEYGPGFVLDYTQFDQNSDLSNFTSDGITTGATSISSLGPNSSTLEASALGESLNAKHSFELHSYSLSAFKALKFKRARIAGRFGLQYVQIEQELDARTFGPVGTETARLLGTSEFEGFGPRFGLDYFRPVGHTPLELIASATASLLFGNRDQQVSNTQSGSFSDIGADEFITVIDIFTGLQTRKMRGEKRSTFFRFGYVNQTWIGGGTAIDPAGDFGLQGISIAVGLNR